MFKNYIKTEFRILWRNKTISLIKIGGLSIALGTTFIILIFISNELTFENCHDKNNRIYQVMEYYPEYDEMDYSSLRTSYSLAGALTDQIPGITNATTIKDLPDVEIYYQNNSFNEKLFYCTDNNFFKIFDIELITGNIDNLLDDKKAVVISEKAAKKYFEDKNPIGQSLVITTSRNHEYKLFVSGVFRDMPSTTIMRADFFGNILIAVDDRTKDAPREIKLNDWRNSYYATFFLADNNHELETLSKKLRNFEKSFIPESIPFECHYSLKSLNDIYFKSDYIGFNFFPKGNLNFVYIFSVVSILVLVVAILNYILLNTGLAISRHKEIGIRKVVGANRFNIFKQESSESLITLLISLPIALILIEIFLPQVNTILNKELEVYNTGFLKHLSYFILIAVFTGIVSGGYLSFYLSRLSPIKVLRPGYIVLPVRFSLRKGLIVLQIIIFSGLVFCTGIIYSQLQFALTSDLGYNKENILKVFINPDKFKHYKELKNKAKENPYILETTGGWYLPPTNGYDGGMFTRYDNPEKEEFIAMIDVDYNFFNTFQIPILKGRVFSEESGFCT